MARKATIPAAVRRAVYASYGLCEGAEASIRCAYCPAWGEVAWYENRNGGWPTSNEMEFDHIIPEQLGGATAPQNFTLACRACNRAKGPRSPAVWRASRGQN
jgi:5-methylcytosine-specific restriction endonuclease McrA